jgi:hypothetical protein
MQGIAHNVMFYGENFHKNYHRQSLEIFRGNPSVWKNPCLVVSLDVEVGEIDGYSPLGWSNNLPDTVLEAGELNIPSNRRTSIKIQTNGDTVHNKKIIVFC